ncbi:MAG: bifunctional riboflavin kinase/FAD synthetase [Bacteroidales bacterium]|nr:bifunctional riboflavin kinase/FAD synthetase [Bacteroidales bacterium]
MEIISGIDNFPCIQDFTCVTVGTFDGLHIGHQAVLKQLKDTAMRKKLKSAVITFSPHPREVLFPGADICFVLSKEEKIRAFSKSGIDFLVIHPFSKEFAGLPAEVFFKDLLCKKLKMKHLIKGFNNHFGKDRLSDISVIRQYGIEAGFEVTETQKLFTESHYPVSSTTVRQLIHEGKVDKAAEILGYNFFITGKVVHGKHLGRKIGFPTANILSDDKHKIVPKSGVYEGCCIINGIKYRVMLNIGSNPTVNADNNKIFFEAHILNFSGDLYSKEITVTLIRRLRDEKKFSSLEELKRQLEYDKIKISA